MTTLTFCMMLVSASYGQQVIIEDEKEDPNKVDAADRTFKSLDHYSYIPVNLQEVRYIPKTKGSTYLHDEWHLAEVRLTDGETIYEQTPIRVDIAKSILEVYINKQVKYLPSHFVESFQFYGTTDLFATRSSLKIEGPRGYYRVLLDKPSTSLVCHYKVKLIEAHYNPVLDAGSKDNQLVVDERIYLVQGGELLELENKPKKLLKQLKATDVMRQFIDERNLNLTNEYHLANFIDKFWN